jgi:hypothetical protein
MSSVSLVLIFVFGLTAFAEQTTPVIKSWKVFRNDNGYELKHPNCWKAQADNPDENGVITTAKHVFITELSSCQRSRFDSEIPNGISIGVWGSFKSKVELNSNTEKVTKWVTSGTHENLGARTREDYFSINQVYSAGRKIACFIWRKLIQSMSNTASVSAATMRWATSPTLTLLQRLLDPAIRNQPHQRDE